MHHIPLMVKVAVYVDVCQDCARLLLYAEVVVENKSRKSNKEWVGDAQLWNISKASCTDWFSLHFMGNCVVRNDNPL